MTAIGESSAQLALRDPDIRLMLRVRADEPGAFEELVENYQHRLVAVMHHLIGSAEEAEDLGQDSFIPDLKKIHSHTASRNFKNAAARHDEAQRCVRSS